MKFSDSSSLFQEFHSKVLENADIIQATGDAVCIFSEIQCLTPRLDFTDLQHVNCVTYNHMINPLPDDKILDRSKLKQIADDILKCI